MLYPSLPLTVELRVNHIPNLHDPADSLNETVESWQACAFGQELCRDFAANTSFRPWKDTHGKHLCHALRKPHMSPLIGQFASVSECLSVWTPIPQHSVEISLGEVSLQQVPVLTLSKGQRPLQTQWSGTRSYLGESFDLFCSALVPEPTVLQAG